MNFLEINPRPKVHEAEREAMQLCWNDFYKTVLGPLEVKEDKLHPDICCVGTNKEHPCQIFNCHHPWIEGVESQSKKMWRWEEFVKDNYKPPQIQGSNLDKALGFSSLLLFCSGLLR